jgi:hypothetical protein
MRLHTKIQRTGRTFNVQIPFESLRCINKLNFRTVDGLDISTLLILLRHVEFVLLCKVRVSVAADDPASDAFYNVYHAPGRSSLPILGAIDNDG